ncbi:MAG: hypothetical protein NT034_00620, partial [Candidatus Magasanikbacteria bacterium]|nr:hypothetical protein [Candidatus Magasanikbacteria bacterium]
MTDQNILNEQSDAQILGAKLGLFISSMPIDDAAKTSMIEAALLMNEEELVEFISMLEVKYAEFKTQDLDEGLKKDLIEVKNKFAAKKEALNKQTLEAMADLE